MQNGAQPIPQEMQRLTGSTVPRWSTKRSLTGWKPIGNAPVGRDIQFGVRPTHWQHWSEVPQPTMDASEEVTHSAE